MMAVYPASGKAVDDKDLARRKRRDSLQASPDVQLIVLCKDHNGMHTLFFSPAILPFQNPYPSRSADQFPSAG